MSDLETRLDVGKQRPFGYTPKSAAASREQWLTRCWSCLTDNTVDREDTLGLCERCTQEMQGGS